MNAKDDLYSDAMDAAMTSYCIADRRPQAGDGETAMRLKLAAAIDAFIEESGILRERSGTAREAPSTLEEWYQP